MHKAYRPTGSTLQGCEEMPRNLHTAGVAASNSVSLATRKRLEALRNAAAPGVSVMPSAQVSIHSESRRPVAQVRPIQRIPRSRRITG